MQKLFSRAFTLRIQHVFCSNHLSITVLSKVAFCVILQVNGIAFHPVHGTLATVGSDGRFSFWDKDARTKLKTSEQLDQPISACCFNHNGNIFAYASSYDWSKVRGLNPYSCLYLMTKTIILSHEAFTDLCR